MSQQRQHSKTIRDPSDFSRQWEMDPISKSMVLIAEPHHEIHEQRMYFYTDCITLGSSVVQDYMLTVPGTAIRRHLIFSFAGTGQITMALFEGGDRDGTILQTTYNHDRDSSSVSALTVHKGVSGGSVDGTDIHPDCGGSNTKAGVIERNREILLKTNTKYIIRITSGAASNLINFHLHWYEHIDE